MQGMNYVSGKVDSKDKFFTTHGRYEVRAKVPAGQGATQLTFCGLTLLLIE